MRRILLAGGGVIGASAARHVTGRGPGEVVVPERDRLGSSTTWRCAGNPTRFGDHGLTWGLVSIT